MSERQNQVENGWLLAEALPEVFSRHTGLEAELAAIGEEQSAPTACMRFLKAAFELSGRELLSDTDILTTAIRWRRAQDVNERSGQGSQDPAIAPLTAAEDRLACGRVGQDRIVKRWPGIGRLFNRAPGKPRRGVMQ